MFDAIRKARKAIGWTGPVIVSLLVVWGPARAQQAVDSCGSLASSFGPYDYRTAEAGVKHVVESNHFAPGVEALIAGQAGSIGGDLAYVLAVFPNHHRALISMMNYGAKLKNPHPGGAKYSVDCYFTRALRFRYDDAIVHMIHSKHLAATGRRPQALKELEVAASLDKTNGFTQYNVGLLYLEMNEWDRALEQAHLALALGFERPQLKDKLVAAKRWREPAPGSVPPADAAASTAGAAAAASHAKPSALSSATAPAQGASAPR